MYRIPLIVLLGFGDEEREEEEEEGFEFAEREAAGRDEDFTPPDR